MDKLIKVGILIAVLIPINAAMAYFLDRERWSEATFDRWLSFTWGEIAGIVIFALT